MTQTALVTGANGFIGSHLVWRLLRDGWKVSGVIHEHRKHVDAVLKAQDVYEPPTTTKEAIALLDRVRPDIIFHLATALASDLPTDVDRLLSTNITLGAVLLEAASRLEPKPRFIMAGSFWEYATGEHYSPNTLYAATKHCLYDLMLYYRAHHGLRAVSLILFDTYGPYDSRDKLWNRLLKAERGATISLTKGEQLVELVHVRDVASAFLHAGNLLAVSELPEAAYAVSSLKRTTLRSIVEAICTLTDDGLSLDWGAIPYRPTEIFDPWSGPRLPGWSPEVTLELGILEIKHPLP